MNRLEKKLRERERERRDHRMSENEITVFGNKFIFSEAADQLFSKKAYFPERLQQNNHVLDQDPGNKDK